MPKEQTPATIPADSPIRRLYLLALIDAAKHPQIHGHLTPALRDQTAALIAPVLTKEMMATLPRENDWEEILNGSHKGAKAQRCDPWLCFFDSN